MREQMRKAYYVIISHEMNALLNTITLFLIIVFLIIVII
jgi:Mg2+ and Co2+ transporter CorA